LNQSGETMFHWTEDGSRLEFPVSVLSGHLVARLRLARFADGPAEMTLWAGGRVIEKWTQPPMGWRVRTIELGEIGGPLSLRFRSTSAGDESLGVALDWVEVSGASLVLPRAFLLPGLGVLLLGVPLVLLVLRGRLFALCAGAGIGVLAAFSLVVDRLGGLVALATAGPALVLVVIVIVVLGRTLGGQGLGVPVAAATVGLVALCHPFYYYPDVDTHARYLAAMRSEPRLAWDPTDYQVRVGAWTRQIGERKIAFPYSPVFHLLAWPAAMILGETLAVKSLAVTAVAVSLLLLRPMALTLGLSKGPALLMQLGAALLPVTSSRLTLALYPALLGQCLEVLLLFTLMRRLSAGTGPGRFGLILVMIVAQAGYTGSLINTAALSALVLLIEWLWGDRRLALDLLGAYLLSTALVVLSLYARFLPVLWREILPRIRESRGGGAGGLEDAGQRLYYFFGVVPLLALFGLWKMKKRPSARVMTAAMAAGVSLLLLRQVFPTLLRDAKEVELLVAPMAAGAAGGLSWLWEKGHLGRGIAVASGFLFLYWGCARGVAFYAERFLAVGR